MDLQGIVNNSVQEQYERKIQSPITVTFTFSEVLRDDGLQSKGECGKGRRQWKGNLKKDF